MKQLPVAVQKTVTDNFKSKPVSAKIEKNTYGTDEYDVVLADGTKVKFEGEAWDEVSVPMGQSVPEYFVLKPISTYVTANQPGQKITKIERDKKGYEVKLSNGLEIKFDTNGKFVKID